MSHASSALRGTAQTTNPHTPAQQFSLDGLVSYVLIFWDNNIEFSLLLSNPLLLQIKCVDVFSLSTGKHSL